MVGTIRTLIDETKGLAAQFYREARFQYRCRGRSNHETVASLDLPIEEEYIVASDQGCYLVGAEGMDRLFSVNACGIGVHDDRMALACLGPYRSVILEGPRAPFREDGRPLDLREIYRFELTSTNQRIHQLAMTGDAVWAANTGKNCLTRIDRETGETEHLFPFVDRFGNPIEGDNNHINSVTVCGDALLFVAYRAGDTSLVGLTDGETVVGFPYENVGAHDIHLRGEDVYFSDTFGAYGTERPDAGGWLVKNGEPVDPGSFEAGDGYIVRGIAGEPGRTVVGHSHKGDRQNRFDGPGALLVLEDGALVDEFETPFSQVYDIVRSDGRTFEEDAALHGFDAIYERFSDVLGSPTYKAEIARESE